MTDFSYLGDGMYSGGGCEAVDGMYSGGGCEAVDGMYSGGGCEAVVASRTRLGFC